MSVIIPIRVDIDVAESVQQFDLDVAELNVSALMDVDVRIIAGQYEDYTGDYIVVPKLDQQILETEDKHMLADVIVKEIPYYEVSNESGITVYIADVLDD